MGNNSKSPSLSSMTDVADTTFSRESSGIPDTFDITQHTEMLNQIGALINDQKYNHHPDDFKGHEDDEQVNYEIYQQWVQADNMLQGATALLNQAMEYEDMAGDYPDYQNLADSTYDNYDSSVRQLLDFMKNIPEL